MNSGIHQSTVGKPPPSEASDSNLTGVHVAVFFDRLGPYHHARLKAAGSQLRVTAVESSDVDTTYAWDAVKEENGFKKCTLFPGTPVKELPAGRIFNRVNEVLDQVRPQVVAIPGWSDRCSLAALRWCASEGVPVVVMSETTAWDDRRRWWREWLKKRLVEMCSTGLVGGQAHAEYLEKLGVARSRIFFGYDAVDNDYFAAEAAKVRSRRSEVRSRNGLPENFFLASARFIEKKNLSRLIQAFARYRELLKIGNQKSECWDLVILGDGPLKSDLCHLIAELGLQDSVFLPGFKQYHELPIYYGLANAFIHASTVEQWGLVVNEAMASGLPVLISNRCGCTRDLVKEGRNGFSFDPHNVEGLAQLMMNISGPDFPLVDFGLASRQIAGGVGVSEFAEGLSSAAGLALRGPPLNAGFVDDLLLRALMIR